MNLWSFIFLVVLAGLAYDVWRKTHLTRHGQWEDAEGRVQPLASGREQELQREVEELRERVKVLERIATDDRQRLGLADEIEQLRDR